MPLEANSNRGISRIAPNGFIEKRTFSVNKRNMGPVLSGERHISFARKDTENEKSNHIDADRIARWSDNRVDREGRSRGQSPHRRTNRRTDHRIGSRRRPASWPSPQFESPTLRRPLRLQRTLRLRVRPRLDQWSLEHPLRPLRPAPARLASRPLFLCEKAGVGTA